MNARRHGFTFVEVLAALAFLGILMPAIVTALTLSNRAAVVAERTAIATQLAENQLNLIIVDGSWSSGSSRGDFGDTWPGYRWEAGTADWSSGDLTELSMTTFFNVQGREHSVRLTTLISSDE